MEIVLCPKCEGLGTIMIENNDKVLNEEECYKCKGTGRRVECYFILSSPLGKDVSKIEKKIWKIIEKEDDE